MEELVLNEVYDVWYTSFWQTLPGYGILTILGISIPLLGYGIYRLVAAYRIGTSKDKALRCLKALAERVRNGTNDIRGVYQELTDILKGFAQWRYVIPQGTTDYELMSLLKKAGCSSIHCQGVERIMIDAQGVKFGQVLAPKGQVLKDIEAVAAFIEDAGDRPKDR